jgi:hypothetical protein
MPFTLDSVGLALVFQAPHGGSRSRSWGSRGPHKLSECSPRVLVNRCRPGPSDYGQAMKDSCPSPHFRQSNPPSQQPYL